VCRRCWCAVLNVIATGVALGSRSCVLFQASNRSKTPKFARKDISAGMDAADHDSTKTGTEPTQPERTPMTLERIGCYLSFTGNDT